VAPKLKFNEESKIRRWVIPRYDFRMISPPANQTQFLDIGMMFGAGIEYQV